MRLRNSSPAKASLRIPGVGTVAYGEEFEVPDDRAASLLENPNFEKAEASRPKKKTEQEQES